MAKRRAGNPLTIWLSTIKSLHKKLWVLKVVGVPTLGILGTPNGNFRTKWHLVLVSWPCTKYTISSLGRGESCESVFACGSSMHQSISTNYTLTNLLFNLCRSVWIIELLINLLNPHFEAPVGLLRQKSVPQLLFLPLSSPLNSQSSPSRSLGVCQDHYIMWKL
jgi:hypothetical protein